MCDGGRRVCSGVESVDCVQMFMVCVCVCVQILMVCTGVDGVCAGVECVDCVCRCGRC